jgi:hypothetical protein
MTAGEAVRHIALTHVKADRADDVERLVREVLAPLVQRTRPHLAEKWQFLRPDGEPSGEGVIIYATLFYGEASLDEWDLEPMFVEAFGEEEGRRRNQQLDDLLIRQDAYSFSGELPTS